MRYAAWCVTFVLVAATARAQSPYVAGSIGADVTRVGHTESSFYPVASSGDSEVWSGSLRVGTSVGENWGVELEFVHSGRSRGQVPGPVPILADVGPGNVQVVTGVPDVALPAPIAIFRADVRRRHSDFDGVAWVRQRIGGSTDIVYVGGIAFSRERTDISQTFPTIILRGALAPGGGVYRTTAISYSTRPLIGAEARIGLTSHVRLIPGVRLQGMSNGWLLRPYAGLGWFF